MKDLFKKHLSYIPIIGMLIMISFGLTSRQNSITNSVLTPIEAGLVIGTIPLIAFIFVTTVKFFIRKFKISTNNAS